RFEPFERHTGWPASGCRRLSCDGRGPRSNDRGPPSPLRTHIAFPRKDQMGSRPWWPAVDRAARTHILGFVVVLAVALILHYEFLPFFGRRVGIRETPAYFLAIALVPVALWLVPAFSRALARGAYEAHRKLFGREGVYVRLPAAEPVRLRDTVLMSIGPFAIDVLVMAEIVYVQATDARQLTAALVAGLVAFPILLLASLLTSLLPGAWLLDGLELRLVNPALGEGGRPAGWV